MLKRLNLLLIIRFPVALIIAWPFCRFNKTKVRFHFVIANKTKVCFHFINVAIRTRALGRTPQR